jgi:hypothetical protein
MRCLHFLGCPSSPRIAATTLAQKSVLLPDVRRPHESPVGAQPPPPPCLASSRFLAAAALPCLPSNLAQAATRPAPLRRRQDVAPSPPRAARTPHPDQSLTSGFDQRPASSSHGLGIGRRASPRCEEKCYDPRSCPRPGSKATPRAKKSVTTARRANRCEEKCYGTARKMWSWRRRGGGGVYSYSADTIEGPRAPAVKLTARHSSLTRVSMTSIQ